MKIIRISSTKIFINSIRRPVPDNNGRILDGKSGFIGDKRSRCVAFVVGGYAYVCLGTDGAGVLRDMSKFDFTTETWTPMGALTNKPDVKQDKDYDRIPRAYAITFISDKGKDGQPYAYVATWEWEEQLREQFGDTIITAINGIRWKTFLIMRLM